LTWRDTVHRLAARAGVVVHNWPANRFEAMADALTLLRRAAYRPATVIDCGANCGQFATLVTTVFPDATVHLIEPQAYCWPALERLVRERGNAHLYRVAATEPGVARVRMHRGGSTGSTGAFVIAAGEPYAADLESDAATLDQLVPSSLTRSDRALLKLDIEGHEASALRGALRLLGLVEVVLSEVQFFNANGGLRSSFDDVAALMAASGFQLYDFATMGARPRDKRLRQGDAIFVRRDSPLAADVSWD